MTSDPRLDGLSRRLGPTADRLREWAADRNLIVRPNEPEWYAEGYSGARLIAVVLLSTAGRPASPEKVIVKVIPPGGARRDGGRHHAAMAGPATDFIRDHLVDLRHGSPVNLSDDTVLLIQGVADGNLDRCLPIIELPTSLQARAGRAVVDGLLCEWTGGQHQLSEQPVTAEDFVRQELREDFLDDGELRSAVERAGLLDPRRRWLAFGKEVLPNPVLLDDLGPYPKPTRFRYLLGPSHGDLHGRNLLVTTRGPADVEPGKYRLVDLSDFAEDAPLSRDVAMLLVALLSKHATELADGQRTALAKYVVDPANAPTDELTPQSTSLVEAFQAPGRASFQQDFRPEWNRQMLLSIQATALRHTCYSVFAPDVRRWCLQLAAEAAACFHREFAPGRLGRPPAPADPEAFEVSTPEPGPVVLRSRPEPEPPARPEPPPKGGPARLGRRSVRLSVEEMNRLIDAAVRIDRLDTAAFGRCLEALLIPLRPDLRGVDGPRDRWGLLFHGLVEHPPLTPWNRLIAALREELGRDDKLEDFIGVVQQLRLTERGGGR